MLRLLPIVALLSTASIARAEPVTIERDDLRALIERAEDAAKRLDKELSKIPKTAQPKAAKDALGDLRDRLKELRALAQKAKPVASTTPGTPTDPVAKPCLATATGTVIDADAFKALLGRMSIEPFVKDRLTHLTSAARDHLFTVAQVRELLRSLNFASDKISVLRVTVPRLSDYTPAGRDGLLELFPMESDKQRALALFAECQ